MINDVEQGGEPFIMDEAAFLMRPGSLERRCPVHIVRRPHRLEVVNADLGGPVHVPPLLGKERGHVAPGTVGLPFEEGFLARCGCLVEAALGRDRRWYGQLIEMERRKFGGHQVGSRANLPVLALNGDRYFAGSFMRGS